jgi:hypothetical protein
MKRLATRKNVHAVKKGEKREKREKKEKQKRRVA